MRHESRGIVAYAKFCLQADGNAPWSPRLMQYVIASCVPVLISDQLLPPFHHTLDWCVVSGAPVAACHARGAAVLPHARWVLG